MSTILPRLVTDAKPGADTQAKSTEPKFVQLIHLNQAELAARWRISERTLERRRYVKQSPAYVKVGAHVVYRLADIEAYEAANLHVGER